MKPESIRRCDPRPRRASSVCALLGLVACGPGSTAARDAAASTDVNAPRDTAAATDVVSLDTGAPHDANSAGDGGTVTDVAAPSDARPDAAAPRDARADVAAPTDAMPTRTTNCFPSPGACGYPDPAFGTVGVPPGTALTPSGSITVTTPGTTVQNLDVTGSIEIRASNTTIRNVRVTAPAGGSAVFGVVINPFYHASGTVITDTTIRGASATNAPESAVFSGDPNLTLTRVYFYNFADPLEGAATIRDSYLESNGYYAGAHVEDVYIADATVSITHSVLFNPQGQTATVFVDTNGGSGGPGDSHVTITDSLLAGGGWSIYAAASSTSVGTGTMDIANNRFARCGTHPVFDSSSGGTSCMGGADMHGYWPNGGFYGLAAAVYCPPTAGQVWSGNVWDDDSSAIACP